MKPEAHAPASQGPPAPVAAPAPSPTSAGRVLPGRWRSIAVLAAADGRTILTSWLYRGFFLAAAFLSVLALKGMQAEQKVASQMLETLYATYLLLWIHGVVFVAGSALAREQDCLNDAILSRGVTRGEYFTAKLLARTLALLGLYAVVLVPGSFWAIRQDQLVRTEAGYVTSHARNTLIEAWEPRKVFAGADGTILELPWEVGDRVQAGDVLAQLDDRILFDLLETERRSEENARNEVSNAQRRHQDAQRAVDQAEDALARSERALIGKDLLSKLEQADRESDIRWRKRELETAHNQLRITQDAVETAARVVEDAQARVRTARQKLGRATLTAPITGYITEQPVQSAQHVSLGTHVLTLAPLDEFQLRVPIYEFDEFKRLKEGLKAYVTLGETEYEGTISRLGAMTQDDRWGRRSNYVIVRFQGDGTLGLLGQAADVRLVLPPPEEKTNRVTALFNTLTGHGTDDLESRTASVTIGWMLLALGKVLGSAALVVSLTLLLLTLLRSQLMAILATIGLWHVSNLLFDFVGLPDLSYLEMVRTLDKVLGGVGSASHELGLVAWLFALATSLGLLALALFVSRDPPK